MDHLCTSNVPYRARSAFLDSFDARSSSCNARISARSPEEDTRGAVQACKVLPAPTHGAMSMYTHSLFLGTSASDTQTTSLTRFHLSAAASNCASTHQTQNKSLSTPRFTSHLHTNLPRHGTAHSSYLFVPTVAAARTSVHTNAHVIMNATSCMAAIPITADPSGVRLVFSHDIMAASYLS